MTQSERVLRHLEERGGLTQKEASDAYGIERLGARVYDLRCAGHPITKVMEAGKNRYGDTTHYARYFLKKAPLPGEEDPNSVMENKSKASMAQKGRLVNG